MSGFLCVWVGNRAPRGAVRAGLDVLGEIGGLCRSRPHMGVQRVLLCAMKDTKCQMSHGHFSMCSSLTPSMSNVRLFSWNCSILPD